MYLGIDLGTSNSAIVGNDKGDLRLFKTKDGRDFLPSVLYIDRRGSRFVGNSAYEQGQMAPENVAAGFKRLMGTKSPIRLKASGVEMLPQDASSEVIRALLAQARAEGGDFPIEGAVITVPAAFNQMQSEATIEAARAAGLERVGLLQEPVAAAMASLENGKGRDGQFLVYDIGGGTFDVALVQSIKGVINIMAHEGINMLGGRDFDKAILNQIVRPWLLDRYNLAPDFQKEAAFQRLIRLAQYRSEAAKVDLSTREEATIYVSEEEARAMDRAGEEIFLDVPITRKDLESLIEEDVDRSIELCRKVITDNGLTNDDVDRIVLIGGPSKMPCIRDRVPRELGIAADIKTDPMTAVARGAAIFAESREWNADTSERKSKKASTTTVGDVEVRYDFEARVSVDEARIRAVLLKGDGSDLQIAAFNEDMWTSGELTLGDNPLIRVPLPKRGANRIRMIVTDKSGRKIDTGSAELTIMRLDASAEGIPATQTLAVKILETSDNGNRNVLDTLITKGTLLPTSGSKKFRAARTVRHGSNDRIDIEIFHKSLGVVDPELNLLIGSFRVESEDFESHQSLRKGDEIVIDWKVDDNGLIRASVEFPSLELRLEKQFYSPELGHINFEGEEGFIYAGECLKHAQADINSLAVALGNVGGAELAPLRRELEKLGDGLANATEADDYRRVAEEARHLRQRAARIRHSPEFRGSALEGELRIVEEVFADLVHLVDRDVAARVQTIKATARQAIAARDYDRATRAVNDLRDIVIDQLRQDPTFIFESFERASLTRHVAIDRDLHDQLVAGGQQAQRQNDVEGVRRAIGAIYANQPESSAPEQDITALAGLMRG